MLEEQRIGPELRVQDFDNYMSLMNGEEAENLYDFMRQKPPFDEYCAHIHRYNQIEREISKNIWGVVSLGLYEFHRENLIATLESLTRFLQTEMLAKMVTDQQNDMAKLQSQYEQISTKSLTIPKDTAELMESKAYVANTDNLTIPEMEEHLRVVRVIFNMRAQYNFTDLHLYSAKLQNLEHFLWLMRHTIYSPIEIKQNSLTFQWYRKMPSVFKENREIIAEKTIEYQELLRKRVEKFRRDLEIYWEQIQDYENWGDITALAKYKKKANVLDKRLIAAMDNIDKINEEEAAYGWKLSQYPLRKQTHDKLIPYKKLFDAGQSFMEKRELWFSSQVGSFDPDDIENEIGAIYRTVVKLEKMFSDRPATKQLAENVNDRTTFLYWQFSIIYRFVFCLWLLL